MDAFWKECHFYRCFLSYCSTKPYAVSDQYLKERVTYNKYFFEKRYWKSDVAASERIYINYCQITFMWTRSFQWIQQYSYIKEITNLSWIDFKELLWEVITNSLAKYWTWSRAWFWVANPINIHLWCSQIINLTVF